MYIERIIKRFNPIFLLMVFVKAGRKKNTKASNIIVLIKSPAILRQLIEAGYIPDRVNIGGLHYGENRKKILPYVFLSEEDIADLKICREKGISIYCQDVPNAKIHQLNELVDI